MSNERQQERQLSEDEKTAAWKKLKPVHYKVEEIQTMTSRNRLELYRGVRKKRWHGLSSATTWHLIVKSADCLPYQLEREILRQHYPLSVWEAHRFTKTLVTQDVVTINPLQMAGLDYQWWTIPPIIVDLTKVTADMRFYHDGNYRNEPGERGKKEVAHAQDKREQAKQILGSDKPQMTAEAMASQIARDKRSDTHPGAADPAKVSKFVKAKGDPKDPAVPAKKRAQQPRSKKQADGDAAKPKQANAPKTNNRRRGGETSI
jgi:hypothetical protein